MSRVKVEVSDDHPLALAVRNVNAELAALQQASAIGNDGRARVCARRAVGEILRAVSSDPAARTSHAMATLHAVELTPSVPSEIRDAARRLQTGPRDVASGSQLSNDPLSDALVIINYFVEQASS